MSRVFTEEDRRKLSLAVSGEKHPNWKGGVTPANKRLKNTYEFRLWRKAVFERDNYTCIWCGYESTRGKPVDVFADHIKPWAEYPELRLAIDNGRTLCLSCHKKTASYGKHSVSQEQRKKTSEFMKANPNKGVFKKGHKPYKKGSKRISG